MRDEWIDINKKITVYTRRYKGEPKYLTKFLNELTEGLRLEKNIYTLEDFKSKIKLNDELTSKDRIGSTYVGGSIASKEIAYYHKRFKTAIIVVKENFKPNLLKK